MFAGDVRVVNTISLFALLLHIDLLQMPKIIPIRKIKERTL
jgi:hypothetical protein